MKRFGPLDKTAERAAVEADVRRMPLGARLIFILVLGIACWGVPIILLYLWW